MARSRLRAFLEAHPAHCEVRDDWPLDPAVPLLARLCLASSLPPRRWRASVLGIVTRDDGAVLFAHAEKPLGTIAHVLFGGRPKPEELPEETLRREVAEETGWHVDPVRVAGFRHFVQLGRPHPELADRPYPEFIEPVYAAKARAFDEAAILPRERPCRFVEPEWALSVTSPAQRPLLQAALDAANAR